MVVHARKSAFFAYIATAFALLPSCNQEPAMTFASSADGSITLHLANSGRVVDHLDYRLSRPGMSEITGTVPVNNNNEASMRIAGRPAAQGYVLVLEAKTRDGIRCIGAASFGVLPNKQTPILVELSCVGPPFLLLRLGCSRPQ